MCVCVLSPTNSVSPSSGTALKKGEAFFNLLIPRIFECFLLIVLESKSPDMCISLYSAFMMTPWYGNAFRIICPLCGNQPIAGGFSRPIRWTFDIFFVVKLKKLSNKEKVELSVISDAMASRAALR